MAVPWHKCDELNHRHLVAELSLHFRRPSLEVREQDNASDSLLMVFLVTSPTLKEVPSDQANSLAYKRCSPR